MDDVIIIKKVAKDGKPPHSGTYRAISLTGYRQRASLDPLLPDDTKSPRNRRITILLLPRKVSEKAADNSPSDSQKEEAGTRCSQARLNRAAYSVNDAHTSLHARLT